MVERFSRAIYETLILSQYNAQDRLKAFYEHLDSLYCLSVFYRQQDCANPYAYLDIAPKDQPLCKMLLFHNNKQAKNALQALWDKISAAGVNVTDELRRIAEEALQGGCNMAAVDMEIVEKLQKAVTLTAEFKAARVLDVLVGVKKKQKVYSVSDREAFTRYYGDYHNALRGGKLYSAEDFQDDFALDIQVLQEVLLNAFVRAVSMEVPFVNREAKSIDDIRAYVDSTDFDTFLSANINKILYKETQAVNKKHREYEQNAAIVSAIKDILNTLA